MVKPGDPTAEPCSNADAAPNSCRNLLQIRPRVQFVKKKPSLVRSLLQFLTADSFMYGPLLDPPSPPSPPDKPALPKIAEEPDIPSPTSPVEEHQGVSPLSSFLHSPSSTPISHLRSMSTITKKILGKSTPESVRKPATIAPEPLEMRGKYRQEALQVPTLDQKEKASDKSGGNENGLLASEVEDGVDDNNSFEENESSRSFSESLIANAITPLNNESAKEVARRVVKKVGGRFSKELGLFVDGRDNDVERWFLATTFFNQPLDFEQSKEMFKKLQTMGISKIQDVVGFNPSELEEAFESVMGNHRIASRLQKIAQDLYNVDGNGICVFKRVSEYAELKRHLESLSGYSRYAANTFLREMRGVWPGANPDFEVRTRNAAKHLRLFSSNKDGAAATAILVELGQEAGLDVRDLEVALLRVSFLHSRQYRNCPGGRECEYATESDISRMTLSDVDKLIANL